jgi:ABC-2 type transport system permease protein
MNWNVVRKTLKDRWRSTALFSASLFGYMVLSVGLFPTVEKMSSRYKDLISKMSKDVLRLFGSSSIDLGSFNNYMVLRLLGLMWVIIAAAFIIAFTRQMVAGELAEGTLELLLAQPVERWKVLTSEGAVLAAGSLCIVLATVLGVFMFAPAFGIKVAFAGYLAFIPLGLALMLAIAGYSILFSVVFNDPRWAATAAAGLTLVFYLLHFAGSYWKVVDKVDWFGIFHYYDPLKVLESGHVPLKSILLLCAFAAVGFSAALMSFARKDIST